MKKNADINKNKYKDTKISNIKKLEIEKKDSYSNKNDICPYFKKCGGCKYINLSYEEQLKKKEQTISRFLKDIAESQKIKIDHIVGSEQPYNYRNKVHSVFSRDFRNKIIRGIYKEDTHKVVDVKGCLLEDKKADEIIEEVKRLLPSFKYKVYDEDTGFGWLRHVLVRCGSFEKTFSENDINVTKTVNEYMLVLVTADVPFPGKNNFIKAIRTKFPEITTIVQNINDKRTSMVLGERNIVCYGKGFIEDELLGLKFRISPNSFYQVNPSQTPKLYNKAIEFALMQDKVTETKKSKSDTSNKANIDNSFDMADKIIIDAYCGTGTIGMCMADKAKNVIGIELNAYAVKDAISNAKNNGIKNIKFVKADATKWMQEYQGKIKENSSDYILVMDPPRSGSTEEFISAVSNAEINTVVYVSCNPETLARDLKSFTKKKYKVKKIAPFDMFPWTDHVETVCLLSKGDVKSQKLRVEFSLEDMDTDGFKKGATYNAIQDWIKEKYGYRVTNLNIAQVKQKHGIIERENYNKPKSPGSKQPGCPGEKVKAIEDAMRHFQMI